MIEVPASHIKATRHSCVHSELVQSVLPKLTLVPCFRLYKEYGIHGR